MSKNHQTVVYVVPGDNPDSTFSERVNRLVSSLNRSGSTGSTIKADVRTVTTQTVSSPTIVDGLVLNQSAAAASGEDFTPEALNQRAKEEGYNLAVVVLNPRA
jgi:hypothetical protein